MKILLIRHAEPDYDNDTLTAQGFLEAEALAKAYQNFHFDAAYTSPVNRAKITAEIFMQRHPEKALQVKNWLAELDVPIKVPYNDHDVLPWDFIPAEFVQQEEFFSGKCFESPWLRNATLQRRYNEAVRNIDEIIATHGYLRCGRLYKATQSNTQTLVIFCHFGIMSALMSHLLNLPYALMVQYFECQPTGVTTLVTEERQKGICQFRCLRYSDVSHLTSQGISPSFSGRFCEVFDSTDRH